ncbi:MAG: hypothetical protein RLZZ214_3475 [Verrucomicrobiota bacterium]|jgi:predicted phosphodiesterase
MNEPVRVLSDLHLGHKLCRIEQVSSLRPLIAGAGTVIFNGDTWQELAAPFLSRATTMLEELRALCREEGAEAVFLAGNHDPGWTGPGWIELAEGRIVITHGDALLAAGSPWKREILVNGGRVQQLWDKYPDAANVAEDRLSVARDIARELCSVEYPTGRSFLQRAWDAVIPPRRAVKMIEAWTTQGNAGAKFCADYFPKAEVLLIGHFHWEGCWLRGGRRVINTGSFTSPGRAHWVEWNAGWLSWGLIDEAPDLCQKGKTLDVWRL